MATRNEKEIFEPYLKQQFNLDRALTYGEKQKTILRLIDEAKHGIVPISGGQRINLDENNPAVKAVREGKKVAIDGKKTKVSGRGVEKKWLNLAMAGGLLLIPLALFGFWYFGGGGEEAEEELVLLAEPLPVVEPTASVAPTVTATDLAEPEPEIVMTARPTVTPFPTFTPAPAEGSQYEVQVSENVSVADFHQPIAMSLAGQEMRISTADYAAGWQPEGVEWWPKTDIRKVIAIPFNEGLIQQIFTQIDEPVTVRLRNGAAIRYQITDISRVNTFEIENMLSNVPSVAIIFHGEAGDERWLVIGTAIQEDIQIEEIEILEEIAFLTIESCHQEQMLVECHIHIDEGNKQYLDQLILTDLDWWEGGSYPFSEIKSIVCNEEICNVVLAGVARQTGTVVIIHNAGDGATVQVLPTTN